MKSVTLKGKGKSYYLEINSDSSFAQILIELKSLLQNLKDSMTTKSNKAPIIIDSEYRLLKVEQVKQIQQIISQFPIFELQKIICKVWDRQKVQELLEQNFLNIETNIIRSGQIMDYQGNLLLLGDVHQGAIVRATGDIYVGSTVEGIVHAGFPNYSDAIITGDLNKASQVRISDLIQIIADLEQSPIDNHSMFYVNDLHVLTLDNINNLHEIKPQREIALN